MNPLPAGRKGHPKDSGTYTESEKLSAFMNYRRMNNNTYTDLMVIASQLYTFITGAFPVPGKRSGDDTSSRLKLIFDNCAKKDKLTDSESSDKLFKKFWNHVSDIRSLVTMAFNRHQETITRAQKLELFFNGMEIVSRSDVRAYLSSCGKRTKEKKLKHKKATPMSAHGVPPADKKSIWNSQQRSNNIDSSSSEDEQEIEKACGHKAPRMNTMTTIDSLPDYVIPRNNIAFGVSTQLMNPEEVCSAIIVQQPKEMEEPCLVPFFNENDDVPTRCNNIYVIENSPCQVAIYHNLHTYYHFGMNSYSDAKRLANEFSDRKFVGISCKPKQCNYTNKNRNCNPEITVLNSGTKEYHESAFPNMNFDAERIVKLLIFILDDERNTKLLQKNDRNVAQFNFGYGPSHCSDVHQTDQSDTILLKPKILGSNQLYHPVEKCAADVLQGSAGILSDRMQDFINCNLNANGGTPFDDDDRFNEFAFNVNEKTGAKSCRAEAFSINFQYLGEEFDNATTNPSSKKNVATPLHKIRASGKLDGHLDKFNCSMAGYNIVCTFKCFLVVNGSKYCLTHILYSRRSCSVMLERERAYAEPIHDIIKNYENEVLMGATYPKFKLSEIFENSQVHDAGKLVNLAQIPNPDKKATHRFTFREIQDNATDDDVLIAKQKGAYFRAYVIPSMVTPRGWISALVSAYRELWKEYPVTRRQALAFLYIFCCCDCQVKVHFVMTVIWPPKIKKIEKMSAESLLDLYHDDCLAHEFHPNAGGYGSRMTPNRWVLSTRDHCRGALDLLDKYLKLADENSEKEYKTSCLIDDFVDENQRAKKSYGYGKIMLVNVFNISTFLGLLKTKAGVQRSFEGWINKKTAYEKKLEEMGCGEPERQMQLLKHLARKIGYPGDMKIAEHALCKSMRVQQAVDLYFHSQSLFDIQKSKKKKVLYCWSKLGTVTYGKR